MKKALLLSGGQDSVSLAYWTRPQLAITVDYGQLAAQAEIRAARAVCGTLAIEHVVLSIDCSSLGSGDMSRQDALPIAPISEWWPYRNQLLITLAAAAAVSRGACELLIGTVSTDGSHADGTRKFIDTIDNLMALQEGKLRVGAPAISLTSAQLVMTSGIPFELLAWAHSCHTSNWACGQCRGCIKHKNVLHELGFDPY